MFTLKQATILALVGLSMASPVAHWGRANDQIDRPKKPEMQFFDGGKVVVFVGKPNNPNPPTDTTKNENKTPTKPSPTPSQTKGTDTGTGTGTGTTPGSTPPATGGTDGSYLSIVNKWRVAGGNKAFTQSSKLEANARKTAADGNGKMVHQLNPGTMGQVLAPGNSGNFESVYVGGWLCERKNLPGLNGICATMEKGWDHSNGETGHADILTSSKYSQIGCALAGGIWACDVA